MNEFNNNGGSSELLQKLKTKRPKKALSAYMIFVQENRSIISDCHPELSALEVMKQVGQKWQNLSEKERKLYNSKADNDKKRFQKEINKFEKELEDMNMSTPTKSKTIEMKSNKLKRKRSSHTSLISMEESKNEPAPLESLKIPAFEFDDNSDKSSVKKGRRKDGGPRRPLSAYIYFSQEVSFNITIQSLLYAQELAVLISSIKPLFLSHGVQL